jgi:anaerobic magnesium-protoporphyrin IX monomethyl ester cyclase
MKWYYRIGRQARPYEIRDFLFRDRRRNGGPTLADFWDAPQDADLEIRHSIPSQNE